MYRELKYEILKIYLDCKCNKSILITKINLKFYLKLYVFAIYLYKKSDQLFNFFYKQKVVTVQIYLALYLLVLYKLNYEMIYLICLWSCLVIHKCILYCKQFSLNGYSSYRFCIIKTSYFQEVSTHSTLSHPIEHFLRNRNKVSDFHLVNSRGVEIGYFLR